MDKLARVLVAFGLVVLLVAASSRFILGRPHLLLGVKALSLLAISNTLFLMAVLVKLFEKK